MTVGVLEGPLHPGSFALGLALGVLVAAGWWLVPRLFALFLAAGGLAFVAAALRAAPAGGGGVRGLAVVVVVLVVGAVLARWPRLLGVPARAPVPMLRAALLAALAADAVLWACVPDTEAAVVLGGFLVPLVVVALVRPGPVTGEQVIGPVVVLDLQLALALALGNAGATQLVRAWVVPAVALTAAVVVPWWWAWRSGPPLPAGR